MAVTMENLRVEEATKQLDKTQPRHQRLRCRAATGPRTLVKVRRKEAGRALLFIPTCLPTLVQAPLTSCIYTTHGC